MFFAACITPRLTQAIHAAAPDAAAAAAAKNWFSSSDISIQFTSYYVEEDGEDLDAYEVVFFSPDVHLQSISDAVGFEGEEDPDVEKCDEPDSFCEVEVEGEKKQEAGSGAVCGGVCFFVGVEGFQVGEVDFAVRHDANKQAI